MIINHNLSEEEIRSLKNLINTDQISSIVYDDSVNIETIININKVISEVNKKINQTIKRKLSSKEIKSCIESTFFDELTFFSNGSPIKDINEYNRFKKSLKTEITELNLTPFESSLYIYNYIKDDFNIDDESKNSVKTYKSKSGNVDSINNLLKDIFEFLGFISEIKGEALEIDMTDEKYDIKGKYIIDAPMDISIKDVLDSENLYTRFMVGIDKSLIDKALLSIKKKLNFEEEVFVEEPTVLNEKKEEKIPVMYESTMTFAIPLDEIKIRTNAEIEKKETINPGEFVCEDFLIRENIYDEKSLGDFLIKNGADRRIVDKLVTSHITNYFNEINNKKNIMIVFRNKPETKELYIPTSESDNHSLKFIINKNGNICIQNSEYSNFVESGIRYGSVSILDFSFSNEKLNFVESLSRVDAPNEVTPQTIMPVYSIYTKKSVLDITNQVNLKSSEDCNLICTKESGFLVASNIDETSKMDKIRRLGFDEKYYTKAKIAGLNKYSDKPDEYAEFEDLTDMDSSGIVNGDITFVKTSGKIDAAIIFAIISFIIGLATGLSLIILNID